MVLLPIKKKKLNSKRKAHDNSQQYDQIRRPARLTGNIKNTKRHINYRRKN
jgi:hypothetical protein